MRDHFDKNEKNPPGGATEAKYSKQILKLIYLHLGVSKEPKELRITTLIHFTSSFQPNLKNHQKTSIF
jgi:hypothetical protein